MAGGAGLLYSDVLNGGVFSVDRQGNVTTVFAYRKGIRGMSVDKNAGLIVSGRNISWKSVPEGETITVLEKNEVTGLIGFNDITTDEAVAFMQALCVPVLFLKMAGNPGPATCT